MIIMLLIKPQVVYEDSGFANQDESGDGDFDD